MLDSLRYAKISAPYVLRNAAPPMGENILAKNWQNLHNQRCRNQTCHHIAKLELLLPLLLEHFYQFANLFPPLFNIYPQFCITFYYYFERLPLFTILFPIIPLITTFNLYYYLKRIRLFVCVYLSSFT
jgi:hypothetical protein